MANIIDLPDDTEIAPSHHFVQSQSAHYQQSPYQFARGNGTFAADQEIHMAQELSHNMQQVVSDGAPTSAPRNDSHGQNHAMDLSQTPIGPGMGPPHNRQSFSGNPQSGAEGTPDQNMMGDGKRKRSKVSRACDECRRKKIRCDATDDDGSIKTCSNCARISQSCSFSRVPMKRGPSKGYIKELSERVQQVESLQMQLSGQPSGYRQSMDSDYSPDEPYSAGRRNFSFSDQRNPFAAFPRDRIPSTGGWGAGSPTTPYSSRDQRGSIALAPDQRLVDVNGPPANLAKPFWAQDLEEEGRAAKRQKTSTGDDNIIRIDDLEHESLTQYFETIHSSFPLLPEQVGDLNKLLQESTARLTHAFAYVLASAQDKPLTPENVFTTYREVEDYVWSQARVQPSTRSTSENIVWLWTYMFMAFNTEQDLGKFRGSQGGLSQNTLVKLACDLSAFLTDRIDASNAAPESSEYNLSRRAHYVVGIISALHAIATGIESSHPSPPVNPDSFNEMSSLLPDETALLSRACAVLSILDMSIASPNTWRSHPAFAAKNRLLIEQHLSFVFASAPQKPELDPLCKQIQSLVVILLARHTSVRHPLEILTPTLELVDTLLENTTATDTKPKYNPLDIHLFSLAVMTLLEFSESVDEQVVAPAQEGINKIQHVLSQISERVAAVGDENTSSASSDTMHWSSCLLRIMSTHSSSSTTAKSNGTSEKDPNIDPAVAGKSNEVGQATSTATDAGHTTTNTTTVPTLLQGQTMTAHNAARLSGVDGQGDKMMDVRMGTVQLVDMGLLLQRGYLNVVAELCGL